MGVPTARAHRHGRKTEETSTPRGPVGQADLERLARRRYLAGARIRIEELAAELGVSRATAYRWAGNGEQLTVRVMTDLGDRVFAQAVRVADGAGPDRVVEVFRRHIEALAGSAAYRAFIARNPQDALRLITTKEGPLQAHSIANYESLLREEVDAGRLVLSIDPHTMAYAIVRVAESFLYADFIAGEAPDTEAAVSIAALMLGRAGGAEPGRR